jgi:hypothetical protein
MNVLQFRGRMAGYISFEFDSHTTNYDLRKPYTRNTIILDTVFRRYGGKDSMSLNRRRFFGCFVSSEWQTGTGSVSWIPSFDGKEIRMMGYISLELDLRTLQITVYGKQPPEPL